MDANDANSSRTAALNDHGLVQPQDRYGERIERRRTGPARSAYAAILLAIVFFTGAVAFVVPANGVAATDARPSAAADPIDQLSLIEAPTLSDPTSDEPAGDSQPVDNQPVEGATNAELSSCAAAAQQQSDLGSSAPNLDATENLEVTDPSDYEQRGQAALAQISYPWEECLPDWTISFHPPQTGLYGLTLVRDERIEIYVREDEPQDLLTHVIAHEIGHAVDVTFNDGPDRRVWSEARGTTSAPWWPESGATDFATGAGDFAEAFASWQVGNRHYRSQLAEPPTADQIEILEVLSELKTN